MIGTQGWEEARQRWLDVTPGDLVAVSFAHPRTARRLGLVTSKGIARRGEQFLRVYVYSVTNKAWTVGPRRVEQREFIKVVGRATHWMRFGGRAEDFEVTDLDPRRMTAEQVAEALKEVRA